MSSLKADKILAIFEKRYPGTEDVDELIEKMFRSEPFDALGPWVWNEMKRYPAPGRELEGVVARLDVAPKA